jgi:hypothetical protein
VNGGVVLDVIEATKDAPELTQEVTVVVTIVVADNGLDGLSGLISLIERDLTIMVSDMK